MNLYEIDRFSADHPDWEGSFSERLIEYREWNEVEFWKLHKCLIDLAITLRDESEIKKEIVMVLLGIQSSIMKLVVAHYDVNDAFVIKNINDEKLFQFCERFEFAIIGVASGIVLDENKFDLENPLLK